MEHDITLVQEYFLPSTCMLAQDVPRCLRTWNTVLTPMETLSPQSMCHIAQALKDKCKGSVFLNTTIPQNQINCDTVLQLCSLCQCVGASGQGKKGKEDIMQGRETYFKNKKKQGFV